MPVNNLTPTVIADKNGKITTVHKRDARSASLASLRLPAPMVAFQSEPLPANPEYVSRLESVAAANAKHRTEGMSAEDRMRLADLAMPVMANFISDAAGIEDKSIAEELSFRVLQLVTARDYTPLVTAGNMGGVAVEFFPKDEHEEDPDDNEFGDFYGKEEEEEDVSFAAQYVVMSVVETLRDLDLLTYTETPDVSNERFMAHLQVAAGEKIVYRNPEGRDVQDDLIRLVDEYPSLVGSIARQAGDGLSAPAIRAVLNGDLDKTALINGAL